MKKLATMAGLALVAIACGDETTQIFEGVPCVVTDLDGCVEIACPGSDPVQLCDGADGEDGDPGPAGQDGIDGEQGPQGLPGAPGADGRDGAVVAVENFELANISSVDLNEEDCTFSDDPEFAGVHTPLGVEANQQLIVFTQFFGGGDQDGFAVTPYLRPVGGSEQALDRIRVVPVSVSGTPRTTAAIYNRLSVTTPLSADQYAFGMCIRSSCSAGALCGSRGPANIRETQITVMQLAD